MIDCAVCCMYIRRCQHSREIVHFSFWCYYCTCQHNNTTRCRKSLIFFIFLYHTSRVGNVRTATVHYTVLRTGCTVQTQDLAPNQLNSKNNDACTISLFCLRFSLTFETHNFFCTSLKSQIISFIILSVSKYHSVSDVKLSQILSR
jgi:hypothetical protein